MDGNKCYICSTYSYPFSIKAPVSWLEAKWSAGDILTYASGVSLGLLAMWQNQRFKEENDKSQERLEKLTIQANELNIIDKIIENETRKLQEAQICWDDFAMRVSLQP